MDAISPDSHAMGHDSQAIGHENFAVLEWSPEFLTVLEWPPEFLAEFRRLSEIYASRPWYWRWMGVDRRRRWLESRGIGTT